MISHCAAGVSSTPSARATRQVSATASSRRRRQAGSSRSSPIGRWLRAVAAATGAWRASFSHSTAFSFSADANLGTANAAGARAVSSPMFEATVITVRGVFCTMTPGRSSHASMKPIVPPTTLLSGKRPRIISMCSMPFRRGTMVSASAWIRPSASSSAGAFTVTSRSSTGSRNSVTASGRVVSTSLAVSQGQPVGPDQRSRARASHAHDRHTAAIEPNRENPANRAGPENRDASVHVTSPNPTAWCRTP